MEFSLDFFDALRRMKAGKADPATPEPALTPVSPPGPALADAAPKAIGPAGLALIKRFEGCAKKRSDGAFAAYPDPGTGGDPWTIGWGTTGIGIMRGTVWTQAQCDARLERDLVLFAREVARTLGAAPTSQAQFDALVSFHYNTGAIARATLTRLHCAGRYAEAVQEFGRWVNVGGKRLPGLARRRAAEAELYRSA